MNLTNLTVMEGVELDDFIARLGMVEGARYSFHYDIVVNKSQVKYLAEDIATLSETIGVDVVVCIVYRDALQTKILVDMHNASAFQAKQIIETINKYVRS